MNDKYLTSYKNSVLKLPVKNKLILTLYYTVLAIASYLVMFSLMSVSFWVALTLIVGNSIGFYFFTLKKESNSRTSSLYENLN